MAREKLNGVRSDSPAWKVLPHLIAQQVVNTRYLREGVDMGKPQAERAIKQLAELGILAPRSGKQRNVLWEYRGILDVLEGILQVRGVVDLVRGLRMWRLLGPLTLDDEEPKRSLCMHRTTFQSASFAMRKTTQLRYLSCLALSIAGDTRYHLVRCKVYGEYRAS